MSKVLHTVVNNCLECPHCVKPTSNAPYRIISRSTSVRNCNLARMSDRRIADRVTKDTPIPEWCPLPDEVEEEIK